MRWGLGRCQHHDRPAVNAIFHSVKEVDALSGGVKSGVPIAPWRDRRRPRTVWNHHAHVFPVSAGGGGGTESRVFKSTFHFVGGGGTQLRWGLARSLSTPGRVGKGPPPP